MNDYLELKEHLEHSKKKSSAGMPTNLKQESSNIKRASERAKFINQLQQICSNMQTLDEQLVRLAKNNFKTYDDPVRFNDVKSGGGYTANREIANLRHKYGKEVDPLVKQLHNLLNAGKNSPLFTDAEKGKMKRWMQGGGTLDELAKVYSDIFGSVSHSGIDEYLSHGYEAAMHNKKQSQESVKRQYEDVNATVQRLKAAAIKDIMFYIKDYNNIIERDRQKLVKAKNMLNSPAGTQAKSSYVKTNSGQASIREEIKVIEYSMNKNIERKEALEKELQEIRSDKTGKKAKAYVDGHKSDLHHSDLDGNLEHGWFTDLFKKKPTYTATGSTAGMPSNIPVGRDTSSAAASSFTDQLAKLTNNLYQYELEERKSKEAYERYRKLVNDTKKEISRVEKLRNNAVSNSLTAVQKPIHTDKPAKYQHLPQGSKAGMPTNIPRKK